MKYLIGVGNRDSAHLALRAIATYENLPSNILSIVNGPMTGDWRCVRDYKHPTHLNVNEICLAVNGINGYFYGIKRVE